MVAQHGQVLKLRTRRPDGKAVWAYRYRVSGQCSKRPQVGGFATRTEAQRALRRTLKRLRPGGTMTLAELVEQYLAVDQAAPATIDKLEEICAWRGNLPEGHRFEATQALRQVLNRAVAWQLVDVNPAERGVPNPLRRFPEKRPFESWDELTAVAGYLGPIAGPMVLFAAATGLRPAERTALERRDVDCAGGVVYVPVPLQTIALEALDRLPRSESSLLFPAPRGGYIDLHNFRAREWRPAQLAAGIEPLRRLYDLRHTYATFALRAGVSIIDLSRFMGASLAMIDRHYGHLARDGRAHAVALLDAFATETAAWAPGGRRDRHQNRAHRVRSRRR